MTHHDQTKNTQGASRPEVTLLRYVDRASGPRRVVARRVLHPVDVAKGGSFEAVTSVPLTHLGSDHDLVSAVIGRVASAARRHADFEVVRNEWSLDELELELLHPHEDTTHVSLMVYAGEGDGGEERELAVRLTLLIEDVSDRDGVPAPPASTVGSEAELRSALRARLLRITAAGHTITDTLGRPSYRTLVRDLDNERRLTLREPDGGWRLMQGGRD